MTRPLYLADEVRARLAQYEVLLARVASLEAAGEAFLGQIGYGRKVHRGRGEEVVHEVYGVAVQAFRLALAPRSERREGERRRVCGPCGAPLVEGHRCPPISLDDDAPPAAPKRGKP